MVAMAVHRAMRSMVAMVLYRAMGSMLPMAVHRDVGSMVAMAVHKDVGSMVAMAVYRAMGSMVAMAVHRDVGSMVAMAVYTTPPPSDSRFVSSVFIQELMATARRRPFQFACQPDASKGVQTDRPMTGPMLLTSLVTGYGTKTGKLWSTLPTVPILRTTIALALDSLRSTWLASDCIRHRREVSCHFMNKVIWYQYLLHRHGCFGALLRQDLICHW